MTEWQDPIDWQEFRAVYATDSPGLSKIADCFESAGYEFLSYGDLRFKGKQIAVLRFSDGLGDRYAVYGMKGRPVRLSRFTDSGKMIHVPLPLSKPSQNTWHAIVDAIWEDHLRA